MPSPIMTVIMPAYNAEAFIAKSIDSILAQTVEDWELIIIDDGSTDRTLEIVDEYEQRHRRIRVLRSTTNRGVALARNSALERARGDYIGFIDSDDIWYPNKTAKQISKISASNADICYGGYRRIMDGAAQGPTAPVPVRLTYEMMLRRCLVSCQTLIVRRSTCGTVRFPDLKLSEDQGYILSLLRTASRTTARLNEPLVDVRIRRGSLSANKFAAALYSWKLLREVERISILKCLWVFVYYALSSGASYVRRRFKKNFR